MPHRNNRDRSPFHNFAARMLDGMLHDSERIRELYWDMWDRMTLSEQETWERLAISKVLRELTFDESEWVSSITDKYEYDPKKGNPWS